MPDTLGYTKFPTAPDTDDPTIKPFRQEVFNKLVTGWSPSRISAIMESYYHVVITEPDILEYAKLIPPEVKIRVPYLHRLLHLLDIEVDPMGEMQRLMKFMAIRLDEALQAEEDIQGGSPANKKKAADKVIQRAKDYWRFLGDYIERIATMRAAGVSREVVIPGKVPSVRDLLEQTGTDRIVDVASKLLPEGKNGPSSN